MTARHTGWLLGLLLFTSACDEGGGETPDPRDPVEQSAEQSASAEEPAFNGLEGFWSEDDARAVLSATSEISLRADTGSLSAEERAALPFLVEAGEAMSRIYRVSRHPDALRVHSYLAGYEPTEAERSRLDALRDVELSFAGPIARTADGARVAIAPVEAYRSGRNLYPEGATAEELRAQALGDGSLGILDLRTVVRRRSLASLSADRAAMAEHPWIAALHPTLSDRLAGEPSQSAFYGVPYALAYADELEAASRALFAAAELLRTTSPDFSAYLAQRARDLLTNDYEGGDAIWVTAALGGLNMQIGAYETYDDHLAGQKAFASASILIRDVEASSALSAAIGHLPELESALPGGPYGEVRTTIPIGIYDVYADFGQARGANTASILPNDADITRRHGRTILIRRNVIEHPEIVARARARFAAAVAPAHVDELGVRGNLDRTVWHEVGHYLGPKVTTDGRVVTVALGELHNHFEELKADLVSLWSVPRLLSMGVLDEERAHAMYAAGVLRVMVSRRPDATEPYQTMQLMQQNWLMERGVLTFDAATGLFSIDYARYPAAVEAMLTEVLAIQRSGDAARAQAFVTRWAIWNDAIQGVVGARMLEAAPTWTLVRYEALGEHARAE